MTADAQTSVTAFAGPRQHRVRTSLSEALAGPSRRRPMLGKRC